jgi:hypothetical protein
VIKIGLNAFFQDTTLSFQERFLCMLYSKLCHLTDQQRAIGWDQFMSVKWSKGWGKLQHTYAKRYDLLEASKNWQVSFVCTFTISHFAYVSSGMDVITVLTMPPKHKHFKKRHKASSDAYMTLWQGAQTKPAPFSRYC